MTHHTNLIPNIVLCFGLAFFAAPVPVQARTVSAPGLALEFDAQGNIAGATLGAGTLQRQVTGGSALEGFTTSGAVTATDLPGGGCQFTRTVQNAQGKTCTVTDTFTPTADSIRWQMMVSSSDPSWTAPIDLRLKYPVSATTRFWAPWTNGETWSDPLVPQPVVSGTWSYGTWGAYDAGVNGQNTICIPSASMLEPDNDIGLSLVVSPAQTLLKVALSEAADGTLQFQHSFLRLGNGKSVTFTADIVAHEADWRGVLRWMTQNYPAYFEPVNPAAASMAGTGTYSYLRNSPFTPAEVSRFKQMAYRVNWMMSAFFPYFGMWLPPMPDAQSTWLSSGLNPNAQVDPSLIIPLSYKLMNDHSLDYKTNGFFMLNYFNVTEFGQNVGGPGQVNTSLPPAEQWKDPTTFLYTHFPNAIYRKINGGSVASWVGSLLMDPGEPNYQSYSIEQAQRHVDNLPDSSGICIDRMDWLQNVNYAAGADDGVGWYASGRAGRYHALGWISLLDQIGPIMHSHGKVIFANPGPFSDRLELFRQVDGIFDESGYHGECLNSSGLIAMFKPATMWTANTGTVSTPDPDAYFQRHLHMGAYPMAPDSSADHSIKPAPVTDAYYLDYGPLLDAIRGKRWVLQPHCVQTATTGAKVNLFEVPGGYALPVTFGGTNTTAQVSVRNVPGLTQQRCRVWHPGIATSSWVVPTVVDGEMELQVPLVRGCAMVTFSAAPSTLFHKADNEEPLNDAASWTNNAAPDSNSLLIWDGNLTTATRAALGADLSVSGLWFLNPGQPFAIGNGGSLTIGGDGIDLLQADADLTINSAVVLGAAQEWGVVDGRSLVIGGSVSGGAPLTKTGGGTLVLSGANPLAGTLAISGGTLALAPHGGLATVPSLSLGDGTLLDVTAASNPFTLGAGQIVTGSGSVAGDMVAGNGAELAPGVAGTPGTLAFADNLTLADARLSFPLSSSTTSPGAGINGLIRMSGGTLVLSGTTLVTVPAMLSSGTYTLVSGAGAITGGSANLALAGGGSGRQSIRFDTTSTPGAVLMQVNGTEVVWRGTNGNNWDLDTTNWSNAGTPDKFWNQDSVRFDDSAASGTVQVTATVSPGLVTVNNNSLAYTIGGLAIGGSATLVKSGTVTLTLTGSNEYSGGTVVRGGTLVLASGGPSGIIRGALTINSGGAVTAPTAWSFGYNSGACVSSVFIDGGVLTWSGAESSGGTAAQTITMRGGSMAGPGFEWYNTYGAPYHFTLATLASSVSSTITSNIRMRLNNSAGDLTIDTAQGSVPDGNDLVISGNIINGSGQVGGNLIKGGAGTLALRGANNFTGNLTVNEGKVLVTGSLASGNAVTVNTGATMGGTGTLNGAITIAGGTLAPGGAAAIGTLTIANTLTLNAGGTCAMRINKTGASLAADKLNMTGSSGILYSGTLDVDLVTGSDLLAAGDKFTLFAKSAGSFTGTFATAKLPMLPAGLVWDISRLGVDGSIAVAGVTVPAPTFMLPGGSYVGAQSIAIQHVAGSTVYYTIDGTTPSPASMIYSTPLTLPADSMAMIRAYATRPGFADSPVVSATYVVTTSAPVVFTWGNAGGGSWGTSANWVQNVVAGGTGAIADFSTLDLTGNATVTLNGPRTIGSLVFGDKSPDCDWTLAPGSGGSLTLAAITPPTINVINRSATIGTVITGTQGLMKTGAGTLILSGNNTYSGGTIVNEGSLNFTSPVAGLSGVGSGSLSINSGASVTAGSAATNNPFGYQNGIVHSIVINGGTLTVSSSNANTGCWVDNINMTGGALTGGNSMNFESWTDYTSTVTVNASVTPSVISVTTVSLDTGVTFNVAGGGTANVSSTLRSTGALIKSGAGTLNLTGTNTYTGPTNVNVGTLLVNGSLSATSAVTVASAATLGGTGSIGGTVNIQSGGSVTPGNSGTGTLTMTGNATIAGTYNCELGVSVGDRISVTGTLTVSPGAAITITTIDTPTAASYTIASYGTLAGTLPTIIGIPSGYTLDTSTTGQVNLVKHDYNSWAASFPSLTDTTPGGDPDHDGISNLMEYVIGGDPRAASTSKLPTQSVGYANLIFRYKRNDDSKGDTTQYVEYSADMTTWTQIPIPAATSGAVTVTDNGAAPDDISVAIPLTHAVNGKMFARLRVTKP